MASEEGAGNAESLMDREATMREQIRSLQEQRAAAMKEEIARLEQEHELQIAKYELLVAQQQQSSQEAAMLRLRTTKLNEEVNRGQVHAASAEEEARLDRARLAEVEHRLKDAVTKNGTLMLKLKRAEGERDEQEKLAERRLQEAQSCREECRCLRCPQHGLALHESKHDTNSSRRSGAVEDVQHQVLELRSEVTKCRAWVLEKLRAAEDDMEAAKIIYSLHNSLSLEQDSIRQMRQQLALQNQQLLRSQDENRQLSAHLKKAQRPGEQQTHGTSSKRR